MIRILICVSLIFLAPAASAQSCNSNSSDGPEACTTKDVNELKLQYDKLYNEASSSSVESYRSIATDTKQLLEDTVNGVCASGKVYAIGCEYEQIQFSINHLKNTKPSQYEIDRAEGIDDGYGRQATAVIEGDIGTNEDSLAEDQTSRPPLTDAPEAQNEPSQQSGSGPQTVSEQANAPNDTNSTFTIVIYLLIFAGAWWIYKYFSRTKKCPSCGKRNKLAENDSKILEKEVRYQEVRRTVRDSQGKVMRTYMETVPRNYRNTDYYMCCKQCSHNWKHNQWEKY